MVSLSDIFSQFSKALLTHILNFLLMGLFLISYRPSTLCSSALHFVPCLFLFLFLNLFIEIAINLKQDFWQMAGPVFAHSCLR